MGRREVRHELPAVRALPYRLGRRVLFPNDQAGPVPGRPAAHIHARVWKGDKKLLTTECFIKDFPGNERDGQFKPIRARDPKGHETFCLDVAPVKGSKSGEPAARWDISLGYSAEA